jgi:two-component system sensor histidine kinase GlrK
MKITTRIISGYGLFIVLLAGMAIYQAFTVKRMQSINLTLRETNFKNAIACLQALRDHDLVEEYARKYFALADPDYLDQLKEYQKHYEMQIVKLRKNAASLEEHEAIKRLEQLRVSIAERLRLLLHNLPPGGASLPEDLQDDMERLHTLTDSVYQVILQSMKVAVEKSKATSETVALILWFVVFAALPISILVSFLIYRSISHPLANLTEGTRAIAEGKFYYRLDTSRNDEFSQLAKDFNTMTRRLNELDALKKDFVSHVSHELKAPLASMREILQLMLEQIPGPLTDKQQRLLELNLQSEYRLTAMIRNLLDLSRIEAGVMEYEIKRQDLVPLVQNALAEIEVRTGEKQIQIQTSFQEEPLPVACDAASIIQVIVNLVGNAVKFSPKGGIVQLSVEATQRIPEGVPQYWRTQVMNLGKEQVYGCVVVADFGPGIPDAEKERIFERFHQVKQDKKIAGQGVGLGLAISRTIIEAHRGAIWVEDNPGGGSRFLLLLPTGEMRKNEGTHVSAVL